MAGKELRLTVYDFDDTIILGDSTVKFWWFLMKKRPQFFLLTPWFILLLLLHGIKILSRHQFKQAFYLPVNKLPLDQLSALVTQFWDKNRKNIFPWFKDRLEQEVKAGLLPVCISASPRFLLEDIVKELSIPHLLCTEMVKTDGRMTNRIQGQNCRGQEKVRRLNRWAEDKGKKYIIEKFASDSKADRPLWKLSREKFYVKDGSIHPGSL